MLKGLDELIRQGVGYICLVSWNDVVEKIADQVGSKVHNEDLDELLLVIDEIVKAQHAVTLEYCEHGLCKLLTQEDDSGVSDFLNLFILVHEEWLQYIEEL